MMYGELLELDSACVCWQAPGCNLEGYCATLSSIFSEIFKPWQAVSNWLLNVFIITLCKDKDEQEKVLLVVLSTAVGNC